MASFLGSPVLRTVCSASSVTLTPLESGSHLRDFHMDRRYFVNEIQGNPSSTAVGRIVKQEMIVSQFNNRQSCFAIARWVKEDAVVQFLDDDGLADLKVFGVDDHPWSFPEVSVALAVCGVQPTVSGSPIMLNGAIGVKGVTFFRSSCTFLF
jgi:hypothetical protein